ncbi:MAG: hypothetical protein ACUVV6_09585 [Thermoplasmatota archaeon]
MRELDQKDAREIAKSDLMPGFAALMRERPGRYRFDEKAFLSARDSELLSLVRYYSDLVRKGMGWKGAVALTYERARERALEGCR